MNLRDLETLHDAWGAMKQCIAMGVLHNTSKHSAMHADSDTSVFTIHDGTAQQDICRSYGRSGECEQGSDKTLHRMSSLTKASGPPWNRLTEPDEPA